MALEWKDSDSDGIMDNNETISYLNGPRGSEYRRDNDTGAIRWYLYDGLGSVVGEVDNVGNVTASKKFDVYGAVRATSGTSTTKHGFVGSLGHVSEDNTGLIYMRARYMDPVTGRFVSEDSAGDGINWFAYCGNNPVNATDPSGKFTLIEIIGGTADENIMDAVESGNSMAAKEYGENAIQRILTKYADRYTDLLKEEFKDAVFKEGSRSGWRLDLVGVDGKYRIAIDFISETPHINVYGWTNFGPHFTDLAGLL